MEEDFYSFGKQTGFDTIEFRAIFMIQEQRFNFYFIVQQKFKQLKYFIQF